MIIQQKCRWCNITVSANGEIAFRGESMGHLKKNHYEIFKELVMDTYNANEEYKELRAKYPSLIFFGGRFWIDTKNVLKEGW